MQRTGDAADGLADGSIDAMAACRFDIVTTYLCERFATRIRASGYGIGYSLAVAIPAFSGAYMLALKEMMPYAYTPVVLIRLSGILIIVGGLVGPEMRDVELHAVEPGILGAAPSAGD